MKRVFYIITMLLTLAVILVGCDKEEQLFDGTDNGLTSFSIIAHGVTYNAAISGSQIILSTPIGADLSSAEVKYELCEHASIIPDPKTITDWSSQHVFRIKSYSKSPREYTYSVSQADVSKTGNVQFITQSDVDNFAKLGVTVIDGNLIIGSDTKPVKDSIVNVESLSSLKEVRYNITVNRSFAGSTLRGLENIEKCGGLHVGTTLSPIDLPAISGISIDMPSLKYAGDIVLNSSSIKSLEFKILESVSSLYVASNSLIALKLPLLKETVGRLSLDNKSGSINSILHEISFPMLEKAGGALSLQLFSGIISVGFPKLNYVGGNVDVSLNSGALEELDFPELSTVLGSIIIEKAPGLLKLSIPKIKEITSFIYNKASYGSYPLEALDLSSLETINDEIYLRGLPIESLNIPNLTVVEGNVTFWDLKLATTISMPSIKKIGKKLQLYSTTMLKSLDISGLDILSELELISCISLKTIKSPAIIGAVTLNYGSNANSPTPVFDGLENIEGVLYFSNDSKTRVFDVPHIKTIGTVRFGGGAAGAVLNLLDTEKIGAFELSSTNIVELNAPKLTEVNDLKFSYIYVLDKINIPLLKKVETFSLSEHNEWGISNARMVNLDAYSGITSIGSVTIRYCNKLSDFSALAGVIPTLSADKWSVLNCGYNPTYQQMNEGKYVKP